MWDEITYLFPHFMDAGEVITAGIYVKPFS